MDTTIVFVILSLANLTRCFWTKNVCLRTRTFKKWYLKF